MLLRLRNWRGNWGSACPSSSGDFLLIHAINVYEYIVNKRMEEARRLLSEEELSVKEAAYFVGYRSQSHFAQAFKRHFGSNPSGRKEPEA